MKAARSYPSRTPTIIPTEDDDLPGTVGSRGVVASLPRHRSSHASTMDDLVLPHAPPPPPPPPHGEWTERCPPAPPPPPPPPARLRGRRVVVTPRSGQPVRAAVPVFTPAPPPRKSPHPNTAATIVERPECLVRVDAAARAVDALLLLTRAGEMPPVFFFSTPLRGGPFNIQPSYCT